jgi:hypothetical protein
MPHEDIELSRRLFARATEVLEDALVAALAGQSATLPPAAAAGHARDLAGVAEELAALATVLQHLAFPADSAESAPNQPT